MDKLNGKSFVKPPGSALSGSEGSLPSGGGSTAEAGQVAACHLRRRSALDRWTAACKLGACQLDVSSSFAPKRHQQTGMRVLGVQCVRPLSALDSPKEAVRRFTPSWFTVVGLKAARSAKELCCRTGNPAAVAASHGSASHPTRPPAHAEAGQQRKLAPTSMRCRRRPRPAATDLAPASVQVMSTGIVGQVIGTFPYDAPGKLQAGWAFWWLSLVLFCIFLAMLIGR